MQQMQQMPGRPDGMMPNGSSMEMNGMMMRGPGPGGMQGMQRGQPGMGPMMMPGMRHMMGPGHPGMHQGMGNRPPPPEYSMSSQVTFPSLSTSIKSDKSETNPFSSSVVLPNLSSIYIEK